MRRLGSDNEALVHAASLPRGADSRCRRRVLRQRGSRTTDEEVPVKRGAAPAEISEEEFLDFLLNALEPWLER